ncbi:hypothetical protein D6C90_10337 [Aureobasidium pullulans]|uniref:Cryptic loci regulator 2 N-terminal domain-containing protein n=1 Tax=Aureobasidium pullulans TaxID=5580 RepID=A0A4S9SPC0_AURPU|nr:hypothetical protein D6C90_10337 [Aureobasidium pullulans]
MVKPPPKPDTSKKVNTIQQIDLGDPEYNSDGQGHLPKGPDWVRQPEEPYLHSLTTIFNHGNLLGHQVNFINALPTGYAVFMRVEYTSTSEQDPAFRMAYVFGHPSGGTFDSMRSFSRHVLGILQDSVGVCNCRLCSGVGGGDAVQGRGLLPSAAPAAFGSA